MMKTALFYVYLFTLLFTALAAIFTRKSLKSRDLLILVPYLIGTFIMELCLYIFVVLPRSSFSTSVLYNLYDIFTLAVFASIYYKMSLMAGFRKLILTTVIICLLLSAIKLIFFRWNIVFDGYHSLVYGLSLTGLGVLFLLNYFNLDSAAQEKYWNPALMITIGIVVFYPVTNITEIFRSSLLIFKTTVFGIKLYHLIPQVMSIFMYSFFVRAFYLCRKTT